MNKTDGRTPKCRGCDEVLELWPQAGSMVRIPNYEMYMTCATAGCSRRGYLVNMVTDIECAQCHDWESTHRMVGCGRDCL